ncbi:hypothetical protein HMPREF9244_01217 [Alloscardovia omnicolens F0580]|uniref:Uncharacterized protein n=1 Tax=Alloscardovia omnicolens F0580 TaxID=1321816 RepID=U1R807_9BIFI|nr:hypothetical protein HMPREF9244_01217 [Alloscardovia omnicolens F0580]
MYFSPLALSCHVVYVTAEIAYKGCHESSLLLDPRSVLIFTPKLKHTD